MVPRRSPTAFNPSASPIQTNKPAAAGSTPHAGPGQRQLKRERYDLPYADVLCSCIDQASSFGFCVPFAVIFPKASYPTFHPGPRRLTLIAHGKAALDELCSGFGSPPGMAKSAFMQWKKQFIFSDAVGFD